MPTPPLTKAKAQEAVEAVLECYRLGYELAGLPSASAAAAKMLGIPHSTFDSRLRIAERYNLWPCPLPERDKEKRKWTKPATVELPELPEPPPPITEPVDIRRMRDENNRMRRELDDAHRQLIAGQSLRASVMGLANYMPEPAAFEAPPAPGGKAETVILCANDWQWGEVVDIGRMDGLNSYNVDIARARAARLFRGAVDLCTNHWAGLPPARVILIIGGDMISGEIHEEIAKTNELKAIPALKDAASSLMGGIDLLLSSLECPVDVVVVPGNHGRVTRKPESKLYVETSYDTLLGDILDLHYRAKGERRVSFYAPASGDALFTVDDRRFLVTHGDRIGSRGGQGFVGPAATVARGFKRICADYQARGVIIDTIICGHFHVPLRLEEGYVSGTLVGPSEFSRDGRFRPHPASQLFLAVHPERGVTQVREIAVGADGEGALYERRQHPSDRPRYRVKAISG